MVNLPNEWGVKSIWPPPYEEPIVKNYTELKDGDMVEIIDIGKGDGYYRFRDSLKGKKGTVSHIHKGIGSGVAGRISLLFPVKSFEEIYLIDAFLRKIKGEQN
jgi:hypothetical protein